MFRERGRKEGREGEKHLCVRETSISCILHTPNQGSGPQPRHVRWPGIKPATFPFVERCPTHWAIPVKAEDESFISSREENIIKIFCVYFSEPGTNTLWDPL